MAFGTFDILHPGHIFYLQNAKKHGKKLIVVVARDKSAKRAKGALPLYNENERLHLVKSLAIVDKVILGSRKNFLLPILKYKPNVIALGYDHKINEKELAAILKKKKIKTKIIRIKPYKAHIYKSSKIKKAIAKLI